MKHSSLQIIHDEHSSLAAMLRSMQKLVGRGPDEEHPRLFFDVVRAMLFYIDEFPERMHHPKESTLLFPHLMRASPEVAALVERLERDHVNSHKAVRELQHLLLAWELLGESRKTAFVEKSQSYVTFHLEHMQLEESVILPEAKKVLTDSQWRVLNTAFEKNCDPLTGKYQHDPAYDRLFTRIVMQQTRALSSCAASG